MLTFMDQMGNSIRLSSRPKRIISLVPSQSEFLWDIGLREELVGITKFCVHPEEMYKTTDRVGGTKDLNIEKIRQLKPDLLIGNKEENEHAQIVELQKEFPVWMSDIYSLEDAFKMMCSLGHVLNKEEGARTIVGKLKPSLLQLKNSFTKKRVAYFIWNNPYMCAAQNTFIDHVLNHLGFENVLASETRYPEINREDLQALNPDYCFLSTEPFPFKEKQVKELQTILPDSKILIVDGEMFSWYGSRLLKLENYLKNLKEQLKEK